MRCLCRLIGRGLFDGLKLKKRLKTSSQPSTNKTSNNKHN